MMLYVFSFISEQNGLVVQFPFHMPFLPIPVYSSSPPPPPPPLQRIGITFLRIGNRDEDEIFFLETKGLG